MHNELRKLQLEDQLWLLLSHRHIGCRHLGAELASGEGRERIYLVEPTGAIEDDPDLTDQKFPGNPSMSYRSVHPFKVVGEVAGWQGHPPDQVTAMKEGIAKLRDQGVRSLNE